MENIRKHRNIKLVNNEEEYLKNVMKPNFKSGTPLGSDSMACEMGKIKVVMKKTGLSWASNFRSQQNDNVRVPLRLHEA